MLKRLGEKTLGWVILALLVFLGIVIWRMGPERRAAIWSAIWRTTAWGAIAAAVPWSGKLFISRILQARTNWAGAAVLAGFLAVDVMAALLLMTGWPDGVLGWLAAVGVLGVAGAYNYLVAEYLSDMAGG